MNSLKTTVETEVDPEITKANDEISSAKKLAVEELTKKLKDLTGNPPEKPNEKIEVKNELKLLEKIE